MSRIQKSVTLVDSTKGKPCLKIETLPEEEAGAGSVKVEYVGFQFGGPTVSLSALIEAASTLKGDDGQST